MMIDEQNLFLADIAKLIVKAQEMGFTITAGEMWRTPEQQAVYVKTGKSKTMNSRHLDRLAFDLNFFKDGKLAGTKAALQELGDWWESLGPKNRWGGSWRGLIDSGKSTFVDVPHFERSV